MSTHGKPSVKVFSAYNELTVLLPAPEAFRVYVCT